uniref:Uncharacterized protein n=1 Tax=Haptolina ericina TaxID=156174 RepID=A0A7S3BW55_9EUKA|mmetsp:Transcript_69427/g.154821  ORF Transcript_69427/g.154821 Transcript_69427/m.154821 type:complete len:145 (+) Transcript_69427:267-701(+)
MIKRCIYHSLNSSSDPTRGPGVCERRGAFERLKLGCMSCSFHIESQRNKLAIEGQLDVEAFLSPEMAQLAVRRAMLEGVPHPDEQSTLWAQLTSESDRLLESGVHRVGPRRLESVKHQQGELSPSITPLLKERLRLREQGGVVR